MGNGGAPSSSPVRAPASVTTPTSSELLCGGTRVRAIGEGARQRTRTPPPSRGPRALPVAGTVPHQAPAVARPPKPTAPVAAFTPTTRFLFASASRRRLTDPFCLPFPPIRRLRAEGRSLKHSRRSSTEAGAPRRPQLAACPGRWNCRRPRRGRAPAGACRGRTRRTLAKNWKTSTTPQYCITMGTKTRWPTTSSLSQAAVHAVWYHDALFFLHNICTYSLTLPAFGRPGRRNGCTGTLAPPTTLFSAAYSRDGG
jgi:hypothetical protein